jgi:hypothetical protein
VRRRHRTAPACAWASRTIGSRNRRSRPRRSSLARSARSGRDGRIGCAKGRRKHASRVVDEALSRGLNLAENDFTIVIVHPGLSHKGIPIPERVGRNPNPAIDA